MSILVIAGFAESLVNFRGALLAALAKDGIRVHVAAPDLPPASELRRQLESSGYTVHAVPLRRTGMNPFADLRTLFALWKLIRRIQPDKVLAYTVKPVIYGTIAAWMAGIRQRYVLITGLGYAFAGPVTGLRGVIHAIVRRLYAFALRRTHKVFFQNPDDEALFRTLGLLAPAMPAVIINGSGVDVTGFARQALPDGGAHFLLIARLLGDKGVREYAAAARQVRQLYPGTRFSLVGWIDDNPDAISKAELADWVAGRHIDFLGKLADVRPAIAACSVFVLPSYREGTPRTVLEAMAMGRAIITTDAPGCRETVVHGDNGFLVPVKSVPALVEAMLRLIEDPGLAVRMGQRSRQIAEEKYDVHKVNAVMLREMEPS